MVVPDERGAKDGLADALAFRDPDRFPALAARQLVIQQLVTLTSP